jgi:hypothetical protein
MYCPKCSQPQVSDETSFCSRCGFPLIAAKELVANGGMIAGRETQSQGIQLSQSHRGMRKGVKIMLAGFPLLLIIGFLSAINDGFAAFLLLPALCFIVGFIRLLYGTFLEKNVPLIKTDTPQQQVYSAMPNQLGTNALTSELTSPKMSADEQFTTKGMKTAEIIQPPSVTENTTRLLDKET